ncbi:HAMP domain-containing protein, partial [Candidatus Sumerlaeota bacterium]|nr:HAMP domain-containing protein [Candidatus Sumerlaeota bacterium]
FWPLKYDLTTRILMIIIPILIALTIIGYILSVIDMESDFLNAKEQVKTAIVHAIRMAESAYALYGATLDDDMKRGMTRFLAEYEKSGRNPYRMDINGLKATWEGKMDFYVIDENNVVIHTTYEIDKGLDFKTYPELSEYLDSVRKGNAFESHRITPEIRTGMLRKFVYMPTPDHKYVLELGLISDEFSDIVKDLNYLRIAQELAIDYPSLNSIRVFDMNGFLTGSPDEKADRATMMNIQKVVENKKNLEITGEEQGISYSYLYIRATGEKYPTESTRIVELSWNSLIMDREIRKKAAAHFTVCVIAIMGSVLITFYTSGRISQPIHKIVKDVDKIAQGNLDHTITVNTNNELKLLEQSINIMVDTIKDNMGKIRHYSENLEEIVQERTSKLEYANEQLEIFAFSVTHDLRAPLNQIISLCQNLMENHKESLDEEGKTLLERIMNQSQRMDKLILDLLEYSRLSRSELQLDSVNARDVIQEVISQRESQINEKNAEITIRGEIPSVLAHGPTLQQIISNLVSNALKYVEPGLNPRILIHAEERKGRARIYVEDNGIGIEPEFQEKIFMLFERLHSENKYQGTGVGLAIVKKGIEKMGGRIGVESKPGKGSSFWIELPAANK